MLVVLIVFAGRQYLNNRTLHRWYTSFWSGGLIIALGLVLTALNVTQSDPVAMAYSTEAFDDDILEMVPPPTVHPPKKTPPPVFEEVLGVLESLQTPWQPGRQQGRAVSVQFQLPVKFRLEK
jgi:hypothetical protein